MRPDAGKPNPKQSFSGAQTKTAMPRPLEDCWLVGESQDLNLQPCSSGEPSPDAEHRGNSGCQHRVGTIARPTGKVNDSNLIEILGMDRLHISEDQVQMLRLGGEVQW
jgi:hypothetical protein